MNNELENLCGYKERSAKRRTQEEDLGKNVSKGYTTIFKRWGCYECLGYKEKCSNYYPGIKVKR